MIKYRNTTPDGMRDLLFEECETNRSVETKLSELFTRRGYHEVVTPALEYYDLFSMDEAGYTQEEIYKLTEPGGRLLALRPDITMPIARLVSNRLKDAPLPIRLFYNQKVFRIKQSLRGRSNEITQAGIELIGAGGLLYDLETIMSASLALECCGMTDYKIEIGHAGVFKALVDDLPVDELVREEIRLSIESKNYGALSELLKDVTGSCEAVKALNMLPRLFGGREILDKAAELFGGRAKAELDYMATLLDFLQPELREKINVDLGLVHRNNYYTGVVFRGYLSGSGDTVVSGGRYDKLFSEFGLSMPAVGFGIDVDAVASILLSAAHPGNGRFPEQLIFARPGFEMKALRHMEQLTRSGAVCEIMEFTDRESAIETGKQRNAYRIDLVGETTEWVKIK